MVIFQTDAILFSVLGGVILGISTSINYALRGKVTGMSGIVYGIISFDKKQLPQKLTVIGGMIFIASIFYLIFGQNNYSGFYPFGPYKQITQWTTYPGFALAGFLVGFGTKFSNGCTSGHGLCGMARLSVRSFVAVGTFLCTAVAIGTLSYQINGLGPFSNQENLNPQKHIDYNHKISSIVFLVISLILPILGFIIKKKNTKKQHFQIKKEITDHVIVFAVGLLFSIGLMVSGMTRRINILQFLWIGNKWNPQLMFVLASGLIINIIIFQYMIRVRKEPYIAKQLFNPINNSIDMKLVLGAFLFGLGWGLGGLCPGPWIVLFPTFTVGVTVIWGVFLILGQLCAAKISDKIDQKKKRLQQQQAQTDRNLLKQDTLLQVSKP